MAMCDTAGVQSHFHAIGACLYCAAPLGEPDITDVADYFFRAVDAEVDFAKCPRCGSLTLLQQPFGETLDAAYSAYYTHDASHSDAEPAQRGNTGPLARLGSHLTRAHVRRRYGPRARIGDGALAALYRAFPQRRTETDIAYRLLPRTPGRVLDYGCGNGAFLSHAAALGHDVQGIEMDGNAAQLVRARGIACTAPDAVDDADFAGRFDHVSAAHVLEHVPDPVALLERLSGWLRPGGTLFLELPSAQAEGLSVFGRYWRGLEAPRHFCLPTRDALHSALERAGCADVTFTHRRAIRPWLWAESLGAVPVQEQAAIVTRREQAAPDLPDNAEFHTVSCIRT